jgi:arylsulfatase A-like enzyme
MVVNAGNVLMTHNAVYDNAGTGLSLGPAADGAYVVRNILDRNERGIVWSSGVLPGDTSVSATDGSVAAGNIVSNSAGQNVTADWHDPDGEGPDEPVPGAANGFWTNCVYHPTLPAGGVDSGTTSHTWNPAKIWSPLNAVGDPLYADAERGDFALAAASPCPPVTGDLSLAIDDEGPGAGDDRPDESDAVNLRPNVLVIVTDDQRIGSVVDGVMPRTLDWFKRGTASGAPGGTEFADAFVTTPVCCPSRASIFSGQYVHNHGVNENTLAPPPSQDPSNPTYLVQPHTMQRYLRDRAGYRTGLFGKFMNSWRFSGAVIAPNFDDFGYFQGQPHCPFKVMEDPGQTRTLGSAPTGDPLRCEVETPDDYSTTWIEQEGRRFIDESEGSDEQPWLLYLTPAVPHDDNLAGRPVPEEQYVDAPVPSANALLNSAGFQEGLRAPGDQLTDKPEFVRNKQEPCPPEQTPEECDAAWTDKVLRNRAEQLRTLMSVDDMVDGVFEKLAETGEDDDTLAFFISDNGWLWGEHGLLTKGRPYLESIKVPFFLRWPDNPAVDRDATDSSRFAANIDIAPTVLDAVDVTPDHVVDGRSLIDPAMSRSRILTEYWRTGVFDWASLTTSGNQYTEYYTAPDTGFLEYYRFPGDLAQVTNLFGDDTPGDPPPSETDPIAADLQSSLTCAGATCP